MCDCDCELPKRERWEIVRNEQAAEFAQQLRRKASQLAVLRSEDARLKAEGLRIGADMISPEDKQQ